MPAVPPQNRGKILIVEDDQVLARMYQKKFELDGYQVEIAFSGTEGLDKAKSGQPNLVILDIMLPQMDGFEFLRHFRANPNTKDTPVVILTNLGTSKALLDEAQKFKVGAYFVKYQISAKEIARKVEEILQTLG